MYWHLKIEYYSDSEIRYSLHNKTNISTEGLEIFVNWYTITLNPEGRKWLFWVWGLIVLCFIFYDFFVRKSNRSRQSFLVWCFHLFVLAMIRIVSTLTNSLISPCSAPEKRESDRWSWGYSSWQCGKCERTANFISIPRLVMNRAE